jgi:hypothetical protein
MWEYYDYDRFELSIENGKISCEDERFDLKHIVQAKYNEPDLAKLYLLRDSEFYQYVGTTFQSIKKRLNQGLKANGKNGYHGYKWKTKTQIELFVWTFEGLERYQIENVEAELIYLIRREYGKWVFAQNEIHFNNDFVFGKVLAQDIFNYLESSYSKYKVNTDNKNSDAVFSEPGQYGLRGDPYLWKELKATYENSEIKSEQEFKNLLYSTFEKITGNKPMIDKVYGVKRYRFGGMSSGSIHCGFWIEKGFPLLLEQYKKTKK